MKTKDRIPAEVMNLIESGAAFSISVKRQDGVKITFKSVETAKFRAMKGGPGEKDVIEKIREISAKVEALCSAGECAYLATIDKGRLIMSTKSELYSELFKPYGKCSTYYLAKKSVYGIAIDLNELAVADQELG